MNVFGLAVLLAQLSIPHLPSVPQIPSMPHVPGLPPLPSSVPLPPLTKAPPITIEMTPGNPLHQIPELDGFEPDRFQALADLPRTADGQFRLVPGAFEMIDQSFCLRAGAHGPSTASAYLAGSLAGTRASYVSTVIAGWYTHPQFTQGDLQGLLWAITSQTKLSQTTPRMQSVAAALLSPQQITALNGDALGSAMEFLQKYGAALPAPVHDVLDTESQVRDMLTHGNYSYEQLVALAVAVHPADPDKTRNRWSYDPHGFFIRYLPQNFTITTIQVYVPPSYGILRDGAGRIASISDSLGSRLDVTYPSSTTVAMAYSESMVTPVSGTLSLHVPLGTTALLPAAVASTNQQLRAVDAVARTAEPLIGAHVTQPLARHDALNFVRGAVPAVECLNLGGCGGTRVASVNLVGLGAPQLLLDLFHYVAAKFGYQPLGQSGAPTKTDKSKDCAAVKDQLQFAIDYRNLYNDPTLTAEAAKNDWTGQQFQDAVHAKGQQLFGGATGGGDGKRSDGFSQGGETNLDSCIAYYPEPDIVAVHGWPAVMYDAIKNHENAHSAKCNDARNTGENDTWQWRQAFEIDGYNHTIDTLNAWIAANC